MRLPQPKPTPAEARDAVAVAKRYNCLPETIARLEEYALRLEADEAATNG